MWEVLSALLLYSLLFFLLSAILISIIVGVITIQQVDNSIAELIYYQIKDSDCHQYALQTKEKEMNKMAATAEQPNSNNKTQVNQKFHWIHVPYSEQNMTFLQSIEHEFKGNVKFHKVSDQEINIEGPNENYVKFAKHLFDNFYLDTLKLNKALKAE